MGLAFAFLSLEPSKIGAPTPVIFWGNNGCWHVTNHTNAAKKWSGPNPILALLLKETGENRKLLINPSKITIVANYTADHSSRTAYLTKKFWARPPSFQAVSLA